jgi:predicted amidohydrolase YtcJ
MTSMPGAGVQAGAPAQPADLVPRDAGIFTGDPKRPAATALAVRDGSVTVVGGDREVAPLVGPRTRVVDALGHRVVPGLNDSHNHVVRGGLHFVLELRWDGVPALRQGPAMVREQAARTGRHPGLDVQPLGRPVLAVYGRNVAGVPLRSGQNRVDRAEALASYTTGGARLTGEQDVKGILSPGCYADFAVLSDDFFAIPEERIPEIEALLTVVGGRVVHAVGFFEGLAPPMPLVQPDWSPVAHFGGCQAGRGRVRSGLHQAEGVRDAAAESAEHLRWRQRTGRATDGHRPLDTFDPCFS